MQCPSCGYSHGYQLVPNLSTLKDEYRLIPGDKGPFFEGPIFSREDSKDPLRGGYPITHSISQGCPSCGMIFIRAST